ncbi:hypothetical protein MYXO_02517 [Myxococcaceae bacterium]|jgi:ketosteroid isomerase-like protein|nr:hypothetical protein MYXO_02517 [Myxococcaceae bacterium]
MSRPWSGRHFLEVLTGPEPGAAVRDLADEVVWHVPGVPEFGGGTHRGRAAVVEFLARVSRLFPSGLTMCDAKEWSIAGGCVVECLLAGVTASGLEYRNRYAFVFEHHGDGIVAIREYADTSLAERILRG